LVGAVLAWWFNRGRSFVLAASMLLAFAVRPAEGAELVEITGSEHLVRPYELATAYFMTIQGMSRYYRRRARHDKRR
jgi:hypothetical protein